MRTENKFFDCVVDNNLPLPLISASCICRYIVRRFDFLHFPLSVWCDCAYKKYSLVDYEIPIRNATHFQCRNTAHRSRLVIITNINATQYARRYAWKSYQSTEHKNKYKIFCFGSVGWAAISAIVICACVTRIFS